MKKILIILIYIPFILSCENKTNKTISSSKDLNKNSKSITLNKSIKHDNKEREYIIHIPGIYNDNTSTPLIFCFHGWSSSSNTIMSYSGFNEIADTAGFIVVYPQGSIFPKYGKTHFSVGGFTKGSPTNDLSFTNALIDSISLEYNIDQKRIYSTGMSNGGFMSLLLACQLSGRIAAIASVTGSMSPEIFNECNPERPIPIMIIHGDKDAIVPYEKVKNKKHGKPIKDILNYWVKYNNCDSPDTTIIENINLSDNSTVEHIIYRNGDDGIKNEHFKIIGGYHSWPGIRKDFNIHQNDEILRFFTNYKIKGNMDINASAEIWKFFSKYDINGLNK